MLISEQEKKRILEMHFKSGYRTLITEQESTPAELYQKGDRQGLYNLALSTDSENVKSHSVYKNTLEWWLRGQGKVNALIGEKGRKSTDIKQSLRSLYRWLGGDTASLSTPKNLDKYLNFVDEVISKKSELTKLDPSSFSNEKLMKLNDSKKILKTFMDKGVIMSKPELLIPNIDSVISNFKSSKFDDLKMIVNNFPKKVDEYVKIYNEKKPSALWTLTTTIDDSQKIKILNEIKSQSQNYLDSHPKVANSIGEVVDIATDLYIVGKNENLGTSSSNPEVKTIKITGGYPGDANGIDSPEWVEGHQLFPDDGIEISPEIKAKFDEEVKKSIDFAKSMNGKITSIKTWGFSSTSKVPTRYGSNSNEYNSENNIQLAKDRLKAINDALAESFKNNGISITPIVDGNVAQPNMGPDWTSEQRNNKAEYGEKGNRTAKYEKEYGNWRYARAFFSITVEANTLEVLKTITADKSTNWNVIINWGREGMRIKPVTSKTKTNGKFSKWDYQCPYFN